VAGNGELRGKVLRISADQRAPYYYTEHRAGTEYLTGVDVELARLLANEIGFRIDFHEGDWATNLVSVKSGESDVVLGAFYYEDRASYALFSEPYRVERQVLFLDSTAQPDFNPATLDDFLEQLTDHSFRLGIVDRYYYGSEVTATLNSPEFSQLVTKVPGEAMLTELFLNDQIDGFIADRLVGSRTIAELATTRQIHEYPLVVYQANVHAMFSRENFGPIDVEEFNHALESLISSGQHQTTLRHFAAPILLTNAISGNWFFVLDIIGTIAFAISGVLIARKEHYSLFGAFVLASLPAVGGGVIRDLLINREPIGILATPLYMYLIIGTVLTGYALNWILKFVRGRYLFIFDISVWIVSMSRYVLPRNVFEVFDAIGLAAFTVTGVAIASRYGADPLLIWGPLLAALTAAGGGILRDVFRADANNPALKTSFYAEIALCWGMLLSLFIYFRAMDVSTDAMRTAVVVTVVGAFATRMMIVALKLRSPQF
jgi:polar amino acid transport system substrate-binding protein